MLEKNPTTFIKMKLLESSCFEALNSSLSFETGDSKIIAGIESYSCKMIGSEKALYKRWNGSGDAARSPHAYEALSPPGQVFSDHHPSFNIKPQHVIQAGPLKTKTAVTF
jgi:hypothetical protein